MKRPLDSSCVESWRSGISGPRPTGDPAALSRLGLSFLLPGFVVIFVHPDGPWSFQQSGLWEPDASHMVQMSGAKSLEDSSLGAITWGHGPCPLCTRQEGPHAWRMVTGQACLGMLSESWGLGHSVSVSPLAPKLQGLVGSTVCCRGWSLQPGPPVSTPWLWGLRRCLSCGQCHGAQAGRGTEGSLGTSWWFLLSYCLQEMRQSPCSGPQGQAAAGQSLSLMGPVLSVESTCLGPGS